MDKRISLIKTLVSDRKGTEVTNDLSEADAQAFVDTVDEVPPHNSISECLAN